jgi:serine/threonine protein kinase
MKVIQKAVLADSHLGHDFARRECLVHSKFDHPNIIKVYDVFETQDRYVLYMEYAGVHSNYLAKKIYNRGKIKNQIKLKNWA